MKAEEISPEPGSHIPISDTSYTQMALRYAKERDQRFDAASGVLLGLPDHLTNRECQHLAMAFSEPGGSEDQVRKVLRGLLRQALDRTKAETLEVP